jgi:hypothetical protein
MLIFVYRTNINKLRRRGKRDKWRPKIIMKRQHGGIVYSLQPLGSIQCINYSAELSPTTKRNQTNLNRTPGTQQPL